MSATTPRLAGKVAIVTGAGTSGPGDGTGRAIAILFARHGASVVLADASLDNARVTLDAIVAEGGKAIAIKVNVTSATDCQAMVQTAIQTFSRLDILINNVGIGCLGTIEDFNEESWQRTLDVNLKSMVLTSKHALPEMIKAGGGAVVNLASIDGMRAGMFPNVPYAASKAGVISLTQCMAVHHGRQGIRTNVISPGHIQTPMVSALSHEQRELRRRASPLGTEGTAWDVAYAALFLASDEARWINGVTLPVDGGMLATTPLSALPLFSPDRDPQPRTV
jgi:NAD(P)-dependent dehydrogenase (short-subunit alcohol dehydrogenase family)